MTVREKTTLKDWMQVKFLYLPFPVAAALSVAVFGGLVLNAALNRDSAQPSSSIDRSGTPEAASGLAGDYVMHSLIVVGAPRVWADTAAVPILIAGRKCELTMQRAKVDAENRTGWRVTNQSCQ